MERLLRPERLDTDPTSATAVKEWKHWHTTFNNFLSILKLSDDSEKLNVLINFVSPRIFENISDSNTFVDAMNTLEGLYVKRTNDVLARYLLSTRKQHKGESLDEYLRSLQLLAKDCNFQSVTATEYRSEAIRDSFIRGLLSTSIRQRLLETCTLDLTTMVTQARALESAQLNSEYFCQSNNADVSDSDKSIQGAYSFSARTEQAPRCFFCGYSKHPRSKCPARDATCNKCHRKGHFFKVCRSQRPIDGVTSSACVSRSADDCEAGSNNPSLASVITSSVSSSLRKAFTVVHIGTEEFKCLIDSGSTTSFLHPRVVDQLSLELQPHDTSVSMASTSLSTRTVGLCKVDFRIKDQFYVQFPLYVLPHLCSDIILGQDFQRIHESVTLEYGGERPALTICGFSNICIDPPELFPNLSSDCHPIATKSRWYCEDDRKFIKDETDRLLKEGIIEMSNSPWRAQVVVVKDGSKKRLAIDYSQTINKFTLVDAYPLPKIQQLVNEIAQFRVFSTIDLCSAYHQIPIKEEDKPFTAFESCGKLFQFTRLPFGVTNGVACFQRVMDSFIKMVIFMELFHILMM